MNYNELAVKKLNVGMGKAFILAMLAGAFIALAAAASVIGNEIIGRILSAAIFPAGLIMVSFSGVELFSGDILMIYAARNRAIRWRQMFLFWIVVYLGNLVGSYLTSCFLMLSGSLEPYFSSIIETVQYKANMGLWEAFWLGILCNILVCLAVWMYNSTGKVVALYVPVFIFVLCGFEHSIANMFYFSFGLLAGADVAICSCIQNLLAVTAGNVLGGGLLVYLLCSGGK